MWENTGVERDGRVGLTYEKLHDMAVGQEIAKDKGASWKLN